MKFIRLFKECPILITTVVIALFLTGVGYAFCSTVYADYSDGESAGRYPALSYVLLGARDGVFPWSEVKADDGDNLPGNDEIADAGDVAGEEQETGKGSEGEAKELPAEGEASQEDDSSFDISGNNADVSGNDSEEDKVYEFTEVDDDYFCDALFIGDSRTVGLSEYVEELDTRATFYSKVSLTIYTCMDKEFIETDEGKISVDQALRENSFNKIYIMLGINEIGTGDTQYFKDGYAEVIGRIRELQPDAIIYIQGIMHVTAHKSDHDRYFNNNIINERNAAIAELANQKDIFYIDMNEVVDDGNGNLDSTLTFDDVHLKASSYERWHEFLLHNAIVR